jgi:hypothetical protein
MIRERKEARTHLDSDSVSDLEVSVGVVSDSSDVSSTFVTSDERKLSSREGHGQAKGRKTIAAEEGSSPCSPTANRPSRRAGQCGRHLEQGSMDR